MPFSDGNGRTGRIIMYKECLKNNICPFIVKDNNKQKYYDALHTAQLDNDYVSLINYYKEEQKSYFDNIKDLI